MLLIITEIILFFTEDFLSKDIQHLKSIDNITKENNEMIIIGNSLTRKGINETLLIKNLKTNKTNYKKAGIIYLDDTSIIEWYYVFKSYFYENDIIPKKLIINFALNQLRTPELEFEELSRIASYVPIKKLYATCEQETLNFSQKIDLYLAKFFRIFCHRERISKRVLDLIPNYRSTIRKLNVYNKPKKKYFKNNHDYRHLDKIIEMVEIAGIELIFCAMPLPESYTIDKKIISIIKGSDNCTIIGFNEDNYFTDYHFVDGYHLNPEGAQLFTESFADMISNKVSQF
ncbi:MAG: hypothetical protein CMP73_05785 [Flavobacteriales bacterium]|nr:hypothetical protein [Flavobacteriales bacterium]